MPANAGIEIQPLRPRRRGGGFWTPACARVTRRRRGCGALVAWLLILRSAAQGGASRRTLAIRGRPQFWQAPHDFKELSRKICHKIALLHRRVRAGRRFGGAGLVGNRALRVMPAKAGAQIQPLRPRRRGGGFSTASARVTRRRRGCGARLGGFAAIRGRLQFWQAPHDFKELSRKICHKIAFLPRCVRAGRRFGGAGLVGSRSV
jgi:hypothetical protein